MSVCYRGVMRKALILLAIFFSLAGGAWAQQRQLPDEAKPGKLSAVRYPEVQINNRWHRLSPGIRIYDLRNQSILPTMLPQSSLVAYRLDSMGFVFQLWLITPEEAAALPPAK